MSEAAQFGAIVLIVAGGFLAAVAMTKQTEWFPVPGPALFLLVAAVASDIFPGLSALSIKNVERIGVVALIVILFDGGMHVGWRRFRAAALPITALGVIGTFATAAVVAVLAHWLLDFGWIPSGFLGAALAPTDPAVMFSVLGKREIRGRAGTILEGESGVNDPVAIVLVIGILDLAKHPDASFWVVVEDFLVESSVGLVLGLVGALLLLPLMRRISLANTALYPLQALAFAGVVYGVTTVAHGSGFLAVFVAGILVGDARAPFKGDIERFSMSLASLAEIVVFTMLGLTVDITSLGDESVWLDGLLLAALLAVLVRPLACGPLLLPVRLRWGERAFVLWGGLKGAVPILIGALVLLDHGAEGDRIYGLVFVVVALSVLVQGTSLPLLAPRLGVPMHDIPAHGTRQFAVAPGSRAAGAPIRDLPLSKNAWVAAVVRKGAELPVHGRLTLEPADHVMLVLDVEDMAALERLFASQS